MVDIRFRATRRAGASVCYLIEYADGQTWASAADGAWWRCPQPLAAVERVLEVSGAREPFVDVMRRIVPHYDPEVDEAGRRKPVTLAGFLRGTTTPRVQTQRGWAVGPKAS